MESGLVRSDLIDFMFDELVFGGIGGSKTSVRVRVASGKEEESAAASSWPIKPPAPVMRMEVLLELMAIGLAVRKDANYNGSIQLLLGFIALIRVAFDGASFPYERFLKLASHHCGDNPAIPSVIELSQSGAFHHELSERSACM